MNDCRRFARDTNTKAQPNASPSSPNRVMPRVAGLKDRPDHSPDQRRDEGHVGRQPARTDVETFIRVHSDKTTNQNASCWAPLGGRRRAATAQGGPNTRAKLVQSDAVSLPGAAAARTSLRAIRPTARDSPPQPRARGRVGLSDLHSPPRRVHGAHHETAFKGRERVQLTNAPLESHTRNRNAMLLPLAPVVPRCRPSPRGG